MGSEELAANYFRTTQTESKIRRERITGQESANQVHHDVGKRIRETIDDLGGTMPEDLPTPEESVKKIEAKKRKRLPPGELS